MNNTRNTKNSTCAIELAVPATPVKPNAAAIKAITKNVSAQLNMMHLPFRFSVNVGSLAQPTVGRQALASKLS